MFGHSSTRRALRRVGAVSPLPGVVLSVALAALGGFVAGWRRRAERAAREHQYTSLHDGLTGMANRDLMVKRIKRAIADARVDRVGVGLVLFDLARFRMINDTLGYQAGDEVLRKIADRVVSSVRDTNLVARVDGDEFAVLLPEVRSPGDVQIVAERLRKDVRTPLTLDGLAVALEVSAGTSVFPSEARDADELLKRAYAAMYAAKYRNFDLRSPAQSDATKLSIRAELRAGMGRGELVLYYQPKVDTNRLQPVGVEALVRWLHPKRGLLPPGEFLPIIEATELIEELTNVVLDQATRQLARWAHKGLPIGVAVNVSPRCLLNPDFSDRVANTLGKFDADPRLLTLEVTETSLITSAEQAARALHRLKVIGVRSSIDDFGTGYSSLASLRDLPIDELKIDRGFVSDMWNGGRSHGIVSSAIHLARELAITAVAEGVEDARTLAALRDLGCTHAQGFAISKPMPAAECEAWLLDRRA